MAAFIDAAEEAKSLCSKEAYESRRAAKNLAKRAHRAQAAAEWGLPKAAVTIVLALSEVSEDWAAVAAAYVQEYYRRHLQSDITQADATRKVDHVLQTAVKGFPTASTGPRGISKNARALAGRWLAEWRTKEWVAAANAHSGCAPATQQVCSELLRSRACAQSGQAATAGAPRMGYATARSWGSRWRKRWGVGLGSLQLREDITSEVKLSKAGDGRERMHYRADP